MELDAFLLVKEPFNETSDYINHPLDEEVRAPSMCTYIRWAWA